MNIEASSDAIHRVQVLAVEYDMSLRDAVFWLRHSIPRQFWADFLEYEYNACCPPKHLISAIEIAIAGIEGGEVTVVGFDVEKFKALDAQGLLLSEIGEAMGYKNLTEVRYWAQHHGLWDLEKARAEKEKIAKRKRERKNSVDSSQSGAIASMAVPAAPVVEQEKPASESVPSVATSAAVVSSVGRKHKEAKNETNKENVIVHKQDGQQSPLSADTDQKRNPTTEHGAASTPTISVSEEEGYITLRIPVRRKVDQYVPLPERKERASQALIWIQSIAESTRSDLFALLGKEDLHDVEEYLERCRQTN